MIGYLSINVTDYETGYAIEDAEVCIYYIHQLDDEKQLVGNNINTNESGQIRKLRAYAPNLYYSQSPQEKRPYSRYMIEVKKEGYKTATISGVQVFPCVDSIQNIRLQLKNKKTVEPTSYNIEEHKLYTGYEPKEIEEERVDPKVLTKVVVPEFIIVHDGYPTDSSAPNYWVYFSDYIKNVASSEVYPTWPKSTIYANITAIISFTLNRVYTEWYKGQGYDFTITSTTQFDHKYIHRRTIFESINSAVDDIFNLYIKRPNQKQPLLAQYCDGKQTQCPGVMTQWGSKYLGDQGYSFDRILQYYYGDNIDFMRAPIISGVPTSYPGYELRVGSRGDFVKTIQQQINVISNAYPAIGKLDEDGIYGNKTKESVAKFQQVFNLPQSGTVNFATWYEISRIYVAVSKIGAYGKKINLEEFINK